MAQSVIFIVNILIHSALKHDTLVLKVSYYCHITVIFSENAVILTVFCSLKTASLHLYKRSKLLVSTMKTASIKHKNY